MIDDELLPGRTKDEDRALGPTRHAVAKAEREREKALGAGTPAARTLAGAAAQARRMLEALPEADALVADAKDAHRARLNEMANARRAMLPPDAVEITIAQSGHYHDDRRYTVGYVTAEGVRGFLGGCSDAGDHRARWHWFEAELKRRAPA